MAMKSCKECEKQISSDANPCPHCGKKNPHGVSRLVKYGGGALVAVILIGVINSSVKTSGVSSGDSATETSQARNPTLTVDAVKLWKDYAANEVSADDVYKGKILRVAGVVASVDKDIMDDIVLHLQSPNEFMNTMATLETSEAGKAASLSKGTTVTVICKGNGRFMGSPALKDCTIDH